MALNGRVVPTLRTIQTFLHHHRIAHVDERHCVTLWRDRPIPQSRQMSC